MDRSNRSSALEADSAAARPSARFVSIGGVNWLDSTMVMAVLALVIFAPLVMGSVHPWAFIAAEVMIFGTAILWVMKLALRPPIVHQPALRGLSGIALPLGLFVAFASLQLVPLPPTLLKTISPSTYQFYAEALEGWPRTAPFESILLAANSTPPDATTSLSDKGVEGAKSAVRSAQVGGVDTTAQAAKAAPLWLPLSIAPSLTYELVLKLAAYVALFFVILLYPFGPSLHGEAERRFYRNVLFAILVGGLSVACVGILERVFWNGKILWLFVPYDWGRPETAFFARARGPFVDPDHFAAYLNLVLPIAVAGVIFPTFITRRNGEPFHVFCALVALVIFIALLLSLSRAGWLGSIIGVSALVFLSSFIPPKKRPLLLRFSHRVTVPLCAAIAVAVLACASFFAGGQGQHDVDVRLKNTVKDGQSMDFRIAVWRETLPMVRDFPLFGVGLGAFEDVFPHYQSPPWNSVEVWEAHNDYLELLSSAGVVGFGLLAWFFAAAGWRLYRGLRVLPPEVLPVAAALLAAISAMGFQEFFDFNLQIPANAILFTILLALLVRLIVVARIEEGMSDRGRARTMVPAALATSAAILLAILSLRQDKVPYPYNLKTPKTTDEALTLILAHPASPGPNLRLAELLSDKVSPALRAKELEAAVWDDPTNPGVRDLYAQSLLFAGDTADALRQVTLSVYNKPWLDDHFYLTAPYRDRLSPHEREAVEKGLKMAVAHHFENAVWVLGGFYAFEHRESDRARLFDDAAASESDPKSREDLLVAAGQSYAWGHDASQAEKVLRTAIKLEPTDCRPYANLASIVYASRNDLAGAKTVVDEGIAAGADRFELELGLADAAKKIGNLDAELAALSQAVNERPADFETVSRLAWVY